MRYVPTNVLVKDGENSSLNEGNYLESGARVGRGE